MRSKKRPFKRSTRRTKRAQLKCRDKKPKPISVTKIRVPVRRWEQFHDKFLTYAEIRDYLQKMVMNYPQKIRVDTVGRSTRGEPIYLAKISGPPSDKLKMATLVEAGSNGTDWTAISSALFLIDFLTKNNSYTRIMDYLILPCSNPDAYHYSLSSKKSSRGDIVMDLSNNFPVTLGLSDVSLQRTADVLLGIRRWKENFKYRSPETAAVIKAFASHQQRIKLFISLQEGGEKIVYPFGFCEANILDKKELEAVAEAGRRAVYYRCFKIGSVIDSCGLTFGTVIDFLRTNQQAVKFTYILHLHSKMRKAESKDIIRHGDDAFKCVKSMARNVYMYYKRLE